MKDEDKIKIRLNIAGFPPLPVAINRSEEELYRKAAKQVENRLNRYKERNSKLSQETVMLMVAFHFALDCLKQEGRNDTEPYVQKIKELDQLIEARISA